MKTISESTDNNMIPISVLIPTRNEENNLARCLAAIHEWAGEIIIADSQSSDRTIEIAQSYGAKVIQFYYQGGWPKKRQWALDTYKFTYDWILLLDADEILLEPVKHEISKAITKKNFDGYWLNFQIIFLGRQLKYGDTNLWKLFLFRKGKGRYERRLTEQDVSMSDIEIHEHIVVHGNIGKLCNPVRHENINSLYRYIQKHNEYSNWESSVFFSMSEGEVKPRLIGNQAQRRRWLKCKLLRIPGSPVILFVYKYIFKFGFLDGKQGLIYSLFQAIQLFHVKAKVYEKERGS